MPPFVCFQSNFPPIVQVCLIFKWFSVYALVEIIGGSNLRSLHIFDIERNELVTQFVAHGDDLNSVAFLNGDSNQVLISASDDGLIKVCFLRIAAFQLIME